MDIRAGNRPRIREQLNGKFIKSAYMGIFMYARKNDCKRYFIIDSLMFFVLNYVL